MNIVILSLDRDSKLVPQAGIPLLSSIDDNTLFATSNPPQIASSEPDTNTTLPNDHHSPTLPSDDDFTIMSENQAKRISALIQSAFEVELSTDVVVAELNVGGLARRIVGARSLSSKGGGSAGGVGAAAGGIGGAGVGRGG